MTAVPRPPLVRITPRTALILRRCYPGQLPDAVLEQAMVLKAAADGHLAADGSIKRGVGGRPSGRPS